MTPETFLELLTQHNTLVIQVLVTIVLVISAFVIYRIYVAGDVSEGEGAANTQHLEKTLQKFLEMQSAGAQKIDATAPAAVQGGDAEKLREELLQARAVIKERDEKIAALEASSGGAGGGVSADEKAKYEAKINDLEQRLAEYEIIAEDIADLARYREENVKLKDELQKLKAGAASVSSGEPVVATPVASAVSNSGPSEETVVSAPIEEIAQVPIENSPIVSTESVATVPDSAPAVAEAPAVTDELMAEFEAAVAQQKEATSASAAPPEPVPGESVSEEERKRLLNDFEDFVKKS